ncbi:MAG: sigma-70 family RNA polymerase sigma factor [Ruminococcaceae bacterium]|nr:sigma-70 family RNA polymerase sigma factor [Oscillospiraceae bacterium]
MNESVQYRFTAYLMTSIKNERARYCKKLDERTIHELQYDDSKQEAVTYEQEFLHTANEYEFIFENDKLSVIVDSLKQQEQQILKWKFILRLRHSEIAKRLGISKPAMDKRYQRLINKIREELMK